MPTSRVRILIVALNAYPAIDPKAGSSIGGLETGAWKLAVGLSARPDLDVGFVVRHTHSLHTKIVNDVKLLPIIDRFRDIRNSVSRDVTVRSQFPWLHVKQCRWPLIWQLPLLAATRQFRDRRPMSARITDQIKFAQPNVCVAVGNGGDAAATVRVANEIGKVSMLWLQSNSDLDARFFSEDDYVNPYGESSCECRYAMEHASMVLCQTQWQQRRLKELTGRDSSVLPAPIDADRWDIAHKRFDRGQHVLWIGRFDEFHKRPRLCIDIARRCPDLRFVMVVNPGNADVERSIRGNLSDNVSIIDYVPHDEMPALFRNSRLFLSTGSTEYEGFPNVLLEAAATGTPVVALEDFGDFITNSGCGACSHGDLDEAVYQVSELWTNEERWFRCSVNGQEWVRHAHSMDFVVSKMSAAISAAIGCSADAD